jgi:hypothetical protein
MRLMVDTARVTFMVSKAAEPKMELGNKQQKTDRETGNAPRRGTCPRPSHTKGTTVTMAKTEAASNGSKTDEPDKPTHGLMVLREKETQSLISLACDALSETREVIHDLHQDIYGYGESAECDSRERLQVLNEALSCLRTTEHYLLMLSSVFKEQEQDGLDPCPAVPAF